MSPCSDFFGRFLIMIVFFGCNAAYPPMYDADDASLSMV